MIIITSKSEGFRRVGIAHAATPTEYPDDAFTPEQLAALQAEPMLTVVVATEVKEGDEGETTGDGTGEALPEITGEEIPGEEIPAAAAEPKKKGKGK